ncbi:peptidase M22, glycoprotease [Moraxella macacae 0408225]|uniref:tRNA threonylcarbamoyladenosine biosynthesis protein TsaB n=1 Tax=Moraxella macacae 0408225 TaxID=1230338 RepID=L2FA94_9GAMM|nr:tRNA (adenosine(37)-N6)-threonylcarbamoyltransferase complex dimerization subunit type 1 TsaB [Moraxella macacae]ELA09666.1 peptidase M22, glycoprotease [Moraxella macacae 0408225]
MILALDTVFDQCSIALMNQGLLLDEMTATGSRLQTQQILPMLNSMLTKHNKIVSDITAIAFNRGPGAFSGIRINTAVAQALAFAHDLPCLPVSSLQAVAQCAYLQHDLEHVYAVLDARMNQVYFAEFILNNHVMSLVGDEILLDYAKITAKNLPLVGNGAMLLTPLDGQICQNVQPTAKIIAMLGRSVQQQGRAVTAEHALPVYLRHNAWKTLAEQGKL